MLSSLPPAVVIHLVSAVAALVLGPLALLARKGSRPHRGLGYAWVTMMAMAALSSLFIRGGQLPNLAGFSPLHLLTLITLFGLYGGLRYAMRRELGAHRWVMVSTYVGGCVVAGGFALLPDRTLGQLVWGTLAATPTP